MAICCAAIDDINAWLLLAVLTAMANSKQSWRHFVVRVLLLMTFVGLMLFPIRRDADGGQNSASARNWNVVRCFLNRG